jgi:hypothetical protein
MTEQEINEKYGDEEQPEPQQEQTDSDEETSNDQTDNTTEARASGIILQKA